MAWAIGVAWRWGGDGYMEIFNVQYGWHTENAGKQKSLFRYLSLFHALVSYLVLARSLCPNRQKSQGIGAIKTVKNANRLVAHPTPNALYIWSENNGKAADSVYLLSIAAPAAEAT